MRISITVTIETMAGLRPLATSSSMTWRATGGVPWVAAKYAGRVVVSSRGRSPAGSARSRRARLKRRGGSVAPRFVPLAQERLDLVGRAVEPGQGAGESSRHQAHPSRPRNVRHGLEDEHVVHLRVERVGDRLWERELVLGSKPGLGLDGAVAREHRAGNLPGRRTVPPVVPRVNIRTLDAWYDPGRADGSRSRQRNGSSIRVPASARPRWRASRPRPG